MKERTKFCTNCPHLPEGVVAAVRNIRMPNEHTQREALRTRMFRDNSKLMDAAMQIAIINAEVIEVSETAPAEIGDEASLPVWIEGRDGTQIDDAIENCTGPTTGRLDRILGRTGICQAVKSVD